MKITVFGTGYVGLVTGICLAEIGHDVVCVDTNADKINMIKQGKSPIYERGLDELLTKNLAAKKIVFTTDTIMGIDHGDYLFIAVGTPSSGDGSADLQYVYTVARDIGQNLKRHAVVINKSTVPVGTGDKVKAIIQKELDKRQVDIGFDVVSNPEFLKQGDAVQDFMKSDRIIIGAENDEVFKKMCNLYESLPTKIVLMDVHSAELSKYAANAFLATKISFINEIAQFAEKFDADVEKVREGIGSDSRIGYNFLQAGCGYGGSCFPKDVSALVWMAREYGLESPLFNAVENINLRQKHLVFNRLKKYFTDLEGKVIALWGLSFKPNTDDMRDAPSKVLLESLWRVGAKVQAFDPVAMDEAERIYGKRNDFKLCKTKEEALDNADVLVIVTEWDDFRKPDFELIKTKLQRPVIFDGRNLFSPNQMKDLGIEYYCIGRKKS
ncbi:MAG: UDP-glucose/GDP-mannose dehydrogenase family protein [Gammaproteobacteria bacterium]|nr:UDP-glucose/GDP-mannose dehydrogenase family protein [Gammaproteobacteria bacterium]